MSGCFVIERVELVEELVDVIEFEIVESGVWENRPEVHGSHLASFDEATAWNSQQMAFD